MSASYASVQIVVTVSHAEQTVAPSASDSARRARDSRCASQQRRGDERTNTRSLPRVLSAATSLPSAVFGSKRATNTYLVITLVDTNGVATLVVVLGIPQTIIVVAVHVLLIGSVIGAFGRRDSMQVHIGAAATGRQKHHGGRKHGLGHGHSLRLLCVSKRAARLVLLFLL